MVIRAYMENGEHREHMTSVVDDPYYISTSAIRRQIEELTRHEADGSEAVMLSTALWTCYLWQGSVTWPTDEIGWQQGT